MFYKYSVAEDDSIQFITDFDITYTVIFTQNTTFPDLDKLGIFTYSFSFFPSRKPKRPDPKISETVKEIISEFFDNPQLRIMTYICDGTDEKEKARFNLFNKWYDFHDDGVLEKKDMQFKLDVGVDLSYNIYSAVVFYKNNKHREAIVQIMDSYVEEMISLD